MFVCRCRNNSESGNKRGGAHLCVDPELVKQIELDVNREDGRRHSQSQRQVKHLKKREQKKNRSLKKNSNKDGS